MAAPTGVPKQPAAILAMQDMTFTKAPLFKRADECPQNYSLCPSSLSGGCCPDDHSCGTSSCYATTPPSLDICTQLGYQECRVVDGGMYISSSCLMDPWTNLSQVVVVWQVINVRVIAAFRPRARQVARHAKRHLHTVPPS